jgi:hypothetical protein
MVGQSIVTPDIETISKFGDITDIVTPDIEL